MELVPDQFKAYIITKHYYLRKNPKFLTWIAKFVYYLIGFVVFVSIKNYVKHESD